ncbi:DUF2232 domain-containing protein [Paenibacillus macerans]|uniref:DUF2232 domain-containing protein n=1 Tax=Paenibacillus macerans TaxID=44252 RepID=UPI003D31D6F8
MKLRWTSVAWSVVYLLLLLSLATPLTVITIFFLIVPVILLYATLSTRAFLLHIAAVWLAASLIFGPVILLQALYFIIPAIVMGYFYKKRSPAFRTVMAGAATILLEFLLILLVSTVFFKFNLTTAIEDMVNTALAPLQDAADSSLAGGVVWSPEMSAQFSSLTVRMIPFTMVVCGLLIATVAHAISRPTLSSLGLAVPKLAPIREWRLPRSLIWYYLIGLLLQLFGGEAAQQGFMGTILLNLMPLLQFFFMVQTASFFFFAAYHRKWNPVIPILLIVVMLFIPPLRIVGILDIAFPLRDMITRSRR